jgi:hypothetical protein
MDSQWYLIIPAALGLLGCRAPDHDVAPPASGAAVSYRTECDVDALAQELESSGRFCLQDTILLSDVDAELCRRQGPALTAGGIVGFLEAAEPRIRALTGAQCPGCEIVQLSFTAELVVRACYRSGYPAGYRLQHYRTVQVETQPPIEVLRVISARAWIRDADGDRWITVSE